MAYKYYVQPFREGTVRYVAYGANPYKLPVYERTPKDKRHYMALSMSFPSCLHFLPEAELAEEERLTKAEIVAKYGEPYTSKGKKIQYFLPGS